MALTKDEISWVAHLSRIEIDDAMSEKMAAQLTQILGYIEKLNELDTNGVEPLSHPGALKNVFRDDIPTGSIETAQALKNAPDKLNGCFRVPRVIE